MAEAETRDLAALERRLRAIGVQEGIAAESRAAEDASEAASKAVEEAFDSGFGPAFVKAAEIGRLLGRLRIVPQPPQEESAALYAVAAEKRLDDAAEAEAILVDKSAALRKLQAHLGPCVTAPSMTTVVEDEDNEPAEG
ncbi:Hypothetical Protein FCC1311_022222 [Hondaea fermentalgiana]|uniref:Uncharacterized protein n=1 Tax=Hondaea fermentalgiana TaxID=2315210 RepID=A0A2R5G4P8_9STRA|nr:Hypothetical Protein FCC1311_022222 [Hondaea fermentalgiana]|eukprot:GBG26002.1 Hypothetical Protein FCC1311_022222 [Hondaea fermentalgiana]